MGKKRTAEEKRIHLLKKLKRLEETIENDPKAARKATSDSSSPVPVPDASSQRRENSSPEPEADLAPELLLEPELEQDIIELPEPESDNIVKIEESILAILGDAPLPDTQGQNLHNEIADRWTDILKKGLKKDEKDILYKENPSFSNCNLMKAPKLNPEVSAAVNELARRRDQIIEKRQLQISTALSCLGSALQLCVKDILTSKLEIIKKINQTSRLLCDSLYLDTKGRRSLILSTINRDMKESLAQSEPGSYLFGENLTDTIKTAKSVQKSVSDLKIPDNNKKVVGRQNTPQSRKPSNTNRALNWRGPPRPDPRTSSAVTGGPSYNRRFQGPVQAKKKEDRTYQRRR